MPTQSDVEEFQSPSKLPPKLSPEELNRPVRRRQVGRPAAAAPEQPRSESPGPATRAPATPIHPDYWGKALVAMGIAIVALCVLVVPGLVGGGGSKNPVAEAAQTTMDNSLRVTFGGSVGSADGGVINMQGAGVWNGDAKKAAFQFTMSGTNLPSGKFNFGEAIDGTDVYVHMPDQISRITGGSPWLLVRGAACSNLFRESGGLGGGNGSPSDPQQQLEMLKSASKDVTTLGQEEVDGVSTTHYVATIDVQKVLEEQTDQLPDRLASVMQDRIDQTNPQETVEVWIDDQGLLRRMRVQGSLAGVGSFSMTMVFSDYGSRPQVNLPPDDQVRDITPQLEQSMAELQNT